MQELIDRILQFPKGQKIGLLFGLIFIVAAFYQMFVYSPRSVKILNLKDEIENARRESAKKRALSSNFPMTHERYAPFKS